MPRQPWGEGRAAKLKRKRHEIASEICGLLKERLDLERVQLAFELFPRGSLKKQCLRSIFSWCGDKRFQGRVFTNNLVTSVVRKLCHAVQLTPPPGKSRKEFIKAQSGRLKSLLKAAKKLQAGKLFFLHSGFCFLVIVYKDVVWMSVAEANKKATKKKPPRRPV